MKNLKQQGNYLLVFGLVCANLGLQGCALFRQERQPYTTERDKTRKGASIGAAAGAAAAILKGEREADEILAGAAIGAAVGAGTGFYMDRQEEKLARIPGTRVERVSQNVLLVRFDSAVLFRVDSALIEGAGREALGQAAAVLLEFPKTAVVVQGHTDSTGSEEHNQHLSERRAVAVKAYLADRGVDSARMSALGYGEGYPVAGNDSERGRQQNRRVELLLKAKAR
jgi:outer membrane protein OmpA-like peptidoglycan-associated protein